MNKQEMCEHLKGKSQEEIRNFIIDRLKTICDAAINEFVKNEEYEKCDKVLKIKKSVSDKN